MAPRSSFLAAALVLAVVLACANPLSRFSNQYKCEIPGRQNPATAYQLVEIEDLTKAIEFITSGFGRSLAYATRGSLRGKQAQWDLAIQDYNEAIRIAPEFAYHYEHRGDCYYEKSDYERAVADYSDAIRLEPQNKHFYEDRAKVYRKLGNIELANIDEAKSQAPIAQ